MKKITLSILLLLLSFLSSQSKPFKINEEYDFKKINRNITYYKHNGEPLCISSIIFNSFSFTSLTDNIIHSEPFKGSFIIKIDLENTSKKEINYILSIHNPLLEEILFLETNKNELFQIQHIGTEFPYQKRILKDNNISFELTIPPQKIRTFYIQITHPHDIINIPIFIEPFIDFHNNKIQSFLSVTFYYGILLFAFVFTIGLYISLQKKIFLYFSFYEVFITLFLFSIDGFTFQYILPNNPIYAQYAVYVSFCLSHFFFILMFKEYQTKCSVLLCRTFLYSFIAFSFMSLFLYHNHLVLKYILGSASGITQLFILYALIQKKEKKTHEKIFIATQIFIMIILFISFLYHSGTIIYSSHMQDANKMIISFQVIGITFVLSERIRNLLSHSKKKLEFEVQLRTIELEAQKDFLYLKNNRIKQQNTEHEQSLRYAHTIQNAILPSSHKINNIFSKNFILYKPKNIVSGDFYWATQIKHKKIILCGDCTGHGIPGAFLSILGMSSLNTIINTMKIQKSHEILNQLRSIIIETLSDQQHTISDGMDMSLCIIDTKTNKLEYSGAYNPLYIIRENSIIQLKTDNMPIGNHVRNDNSFTQNHIQLEKKDRIYLFTDGYADQIGGEKLKKLKRVGFREILLDIQKYPLHKQKEELDTFITNWQGTEEEQTDDITLIGFEI
ncbi:MAG: SpoIIE family protein phosphatase [bacterium]